MKREYPNCPLVGVGAIIIEQARVVLVKRAHPPLSGEWSIPGGVLEVGETLRQGAVREALEETGLAVEVGELVGVYAPNYVLAASSPRRLRSTLSRCALGEVAGGGRRESYRGEGVDRDREGACREQPARIYWRKEE